MMDTSDLHVNLNDLALRAGEQWERVYPLETPPVVLGGVPYQVLVPGGVTVTVKRVAGGHLVAVALAATLYGPCERCLREVALRVDAQEEEFVPSGKDAWDEAEASEFIVGTVVDVKGLAREALVLALPAQIICKEECRGLCPRCGRDLNQGLCDCDPEDVDERWNRLKDLKLD